MAYRNRTIPDSDKGVRRFVYNFSRIVAGDPGRYGFDAGDAALLITEADEFIQKSITATQPISRTRPAIRGKNDTKKRVLGVFREYVGRVKADPSVESWEKLNLGVVVEKSRRKSPLPPPDMYPTLWIKGARNCRHELGYWTTGAMTRRGKPRGATHLVLLCHVGEYAIGDPAQARYVGAYTRYPIQIEHKAEDSGMTATYFAAWLTRSGEQTSWSPGVSMTIASAGLLQLGPGLKMVA